jgi:hypothetical protein
MHFSQVSEILVRINLVLGFLTLKVDIVCYFNLYKYIFFTLICCAMYLQFARC